MMALLGAYAFSIYAKRVERILMSRPYWLTILILLVFLSAIAWNSLRIYAIALTDIVNGKPPAEAIDPISTYLHDHSQKDDTVLVWGAVPGINLMSGRESPTAFFGYPLFVPSPLSTQFDDRFLSDLESHPPALIVDVYYLVAGNLLGETEFCFSLDPVIRAKQLAQLGQNATIRLPKNIEHVYRFIAEHYHLETDIGNAAIYRLSP